MKQGGRRRKHDDAHFPLAGRGKRAPRATTHRVKVVTQEPCATDEDAILAKSRRLALERLLK